MPTPFLYLMVGLLAALLVLNLWLTYRIFTDPLCTTSQRVAQTALLWLLPGIGAWLVLAVRRKPEAGSGAYAEEHEHDFGDLHSSGNRSNSRSSDGPD